jgi:hypothetical protein
MLIRKRIFILLIASIFLFTSCGRKNSPFVQSGEYLCVSIKNLMQEVHKKIAAGESLPDEMNNLGGITWLEGYVVDPQNSDIILFGKKIENRPSYQLSDLLDSFINVYADSAAPYCSLDPRPESILKINQVFNSSVLTGKSLDEKAAILSDAIGPQMTVIGGIPRNSNHAFVMIDADYHMKKVSQGLVKLKGITSCLDQRLNAAKDSSSGLKDDLTSSSMSRFWFHIKPKDDNVYPNFLESDNIVYISECPVVLLTENQVSDEKGILSDKKQDNPVAIEFAKSMSVNFSKLTDSVKVYAELENLFRLNALLRAAKFKLDNSDIYKSICRSTEGLSYSSKNEMPVSLPGLVNLKEYKVEKKEKKSIVTESSLFMVCGGVGMEMDVQKESLAKEITLANFQNKVIQFRPDKNACIWTVN